ncbi:MAG TPA: cytochrome P450 [Polyangiaceae bacterium]|nr:cytochrome P450 [Polyangiaceae bacterium]
MLPPGPRTPALWQTYRFVTQPADYMRSMKDNYGDAVSFHSLAGRGVAVMEPELAREVFGAPPDTFEAIPLVESLFGSTAVIAVSGERHKKLRKLLNPRFHGQQVKGFLAAMQRAVRTALEGFAQAAGTRRVVTMTDVTQAMALDVIIETVFGAQELDRDLAREVLLGVVRGFTPSIIGGGTFHKPWFPPWRRYVRACAAFDRWVLDLVQRRRARGTGGMGDDVLGVLLSARYEDGSPMDDAEVRDQLFTLLLAGHETSAIAMAWCTYYLIRTPDVLARLREEVDALGPKPSAEAITKLRYLDAVVSESLRIEPIVTDIIRVCREPFALGGKWTVPRGNVVAVLLASILRDPRVFPEPEVFRPERFLEKKYAASEFLPFGGGARRCLGAAFAQAELAIAVAEIASHWNLELASSEPETAVRRNLTMGPRHGVRVRVAGRRVEKGEMNRQDAGSAV